MAIATLIIAAIYALLPTLISLLTSASVHSVGAIMDKRLFTINGNVIEVLETMLGAGSSLNFIESFNLAELIFDLAISLTIITMLLSIVSSYVDSLQGEQSENPFKILVRALITVALLFLVFGTPRTGRWFPTKGLLYYFGEMLGSIIGAINADYSILESAIQAINFSFVVSPVEQITLIVFSFALFKSTLEAGLVFVERWLTFALTIFFGPIFVSFNASKKTSETARNWFMAVLTQGITIIVSFIIIRMYFSSMSGLEGINVSESVAPFTNMLFSFALSIALLSLYKHSEKLLNLVGIRTIANTDSLKEYARGSIAAGRLWAATGGTIGRSIVHNAAKALYEKGSHSVAVATRNRFGENSQIAKFTSALDAKTSPDTISSGKAARIDNNGRYTMDGISVKKNAMRSGDISLRQAENLKGSVVSVNKALNSGVGTPVSMKDVSTANGLHELSNLKTGSYGVVGEMKKQTIDASSGRISEKPIQTINFAGSQTYDGKETNPKMYSIVPDSQVLEPGTKVTVAKSSDGSFDLNYQISKANPISIQNGQAYMYELEAKPLTQNEFESDTQLSNTFNNDYGMYRQTFTEASQNVNAGLQVDGFDYAWKNNASDTISQAMFGSSQTDDQTRQTISNNVTEVLSKTGLDSQIEKAAIEEKQQELADIETSSYHAENSDDDYITEDKLFISENRRNSKRNRNKSNKE